MKGSRLFRLTSFDDSDDLDAEIFDEWLQWTEFEKALSESCIEKAGT